MIELLFIWIYVCMGVGASYHAFQQFIKEAKIRQNGKLDWPDKTVLPVIVVVIFIVLWPITAGYALYNYDD